MKKNIEQSRVCEGSPVGAWGLWWEGFMERYDLSFNSSGKE